MSRKYRNNKLETACGETKPTKVELKNRIKALKLEVVRYNNHLDVLADMTKDYEYNEDTVATLIGKATMALSNAKERLEDAKN